MAIIVIIQKDSKASQRFVMSDDTATSMESYRQTLIQPKPSEAGVDWTPMYATVLDMIAGSLVKHLVGPALLAFPYGSVAAIKQQISTSQTQLEQAQEAAIREVLKDSAAEAKL